jgi:hypothetical protein
MDFIPFEKVSIKEAKAALERNAPAPAPEKIWGPFREPVSPHRCDLTKEAIEWLYTLPTEIRPITLALKYARIINKIADLWQRPLYCERYLDGLILDQRGRREGFPSEVTKEIAVLKIYFYAHVAQPHLNPWGDRIGRKSQQP